MNEDEIDEAAAISERIEDIEMVLDALRRLSDTLDLLRMTNERSSYRYDRTT